TQGRKISPQNPNLNIRRFPNLRMFPSSEIGSRRMVSERVSQRALFGVSALLFAASAAATILWCTSMSAMGEMPMPGGWTMSMAWMRMPGQTWLGAAASFLGMWVVMMVAMMLPSLAPMLWRYRQAVGRTGETRPARAARARAGAVAGRGG